MKEARYTGIGAESLCILTLRRCRLILLAALLVASADGDLRRGELFGRAGAAI